MTHGHAAPSFQKPALAVISFVRCSPVLLNAPTGKPASSAICIYLSTHPVSSVTLCPFTPLNLVSSVTSIIQYHLCGMRPTCQLRPSAPGSLIHTAKCPCRWAGYEASLGVIMRQCLFQKKGVVHSSGSSAVVGAGISSQSIPTGMIRSAPCQPATLNVVCLGSGLISPDQLMPALLTTACASDILGSHTLENAPEIKVRPLPDHVKPACQRCRG